MKKSKKRNNLNRFKEELKKPVLYHDLKLNEEYHLVIKCDTKIPKEDDNILYHLRKRIFCTICFSLD
jgi:hypothetical protein